MKLHGKIQNGVVVLAGGVNLPEGTPVTVLVEQLQPAQEERMTDEERRRLLAALDEVSSLPNESPGDTFSGADHDKVLYPAEGRMP